MDFKSIDLNDTGNGSNALSIFKINSPKNDMNSSSTQLQ